MKEAVINAANKYGYDGTGAGGLEGFMFLLCHKERKVMGMLLARIMPEQVNVSDTREVVLRTAEELRRSLAERGLHVDKIYPRLRFQPVAPQEDVEVSPSSSVDVE